MAETLIERLRARHNQLKGVRRPFETHWSAINEQLFPWRLRWGKDRLNQPQRNTTIVNGTPVRSVSRLSAALLAYFTSPAKPWCRLSPANPNLSDNAAVKEWLWELERRIFGVLQRSNFYRTLATAVYPQLAGPATAAFFLDEHEKKGVWCTPMMLGEYWIDVNYEGRVDTCFRELYYTARQLVQRFGYNACSRAVREACDSGKADTLVTTIHAVLPNDKRELQYAGPAGMPFASYWWEESTPDSQLLRESGFEEFPVMVPRWLTLPGETYGVGPGWEAFGDCKELQFHAQALLELIDKTRRPPMKASSNLKSSTVMLRGGDTTYIPEGTQGLLEPALVIHPAAIAETRAQIKEVEQRIKEDFYVDLILAVVSDLRLARATATEVEARRAEAMLQLGPMLHSVDDDMLEPTVIRTAGILQRRGAELVPGEGLLPPPPPELVGQQLNIEYTSILHQALKMTAMSGINTLVVTAANLAAAGLPSAMDKLDSDAIIDEAVDILGVRPELVNSQDEVNAMRAQRREQEQAAVQGQAMLAATQGARNLSSVDPDQMQRLAETMLPGVAAGAANSGGLA